MRIGAWAKALEAAIDKNLGIDTEEANQTIEAANAVEGSLLDTELAKTAKEKLKGTTEKLGAVVGNVREQVGKTVKGAGPRAVPSPDDFFSDFGFLEAKKTPGKSADKALAPDSPAEKSMEDPKPARPAKTLATNEDAKLAGKAVAAKTAGAAASKLFDDDGFPEPASKLSKAEPSAAAPSSAPAAAEAPAQQDEQVSYDDVAAEQPDGAADTSAWDADDLDDALLQAVTEQPPPAAAEEASADRPEQATAAQDAAEEREAVESAAEEPATEEAAAAGAVAEEPAAATAEGGSSAAARAVQEREGAGAEEGATVGGGADAAHEASPAAAAAAAAAVEGDGVPAEVSVEAAAAAEGVKSEEAAVRGGEAGESAPQRSVEEAAAAEEEPKPGGGGGGEGAGAGVNGVDAEELRVLKEEARQWRQAAERWEAEAAAEREEGRRRQALGREREEEVEQLKGALAKSGQMLQTITLEGEEKAQALEYQVQQEKEARARLEAENATLRKASSSSTALQDRLKELEEEKQGLFKEGERLMVEKQNLETGIKQCRKHIKEQEEQLTKVREQKTAEEGKVKLLEEKLAAAGESKQSSEESIAQIRALSQETTKKLQACEKEKSALAIQVDMLQKAGEEVQRERDEAERKARNAVAEAEAEAKRTLEREKKGMEKNSTLQMEALGDSLEAAQAALKRAEQQFAAKEQRFKQEIQDLTERCTEAEERCQELSSAVPQSTRPLLRQLDNLQQSFAEKQKVWEQVEASLRQRTGQAETEAREAGERERLAGEQAKQVQDAMGGMEVRLKTLQTEKTRQGAELLAVKEELEEGRRREEELNQQVVSLKASANKRAQELAEVKALQRRMQLEEKDRQEKDQEAWEVEREELLGKIKLLEASAKHAEKQRPVAGARGDGDWGEVDIFGSNGAGGAGLDVSGRDVMNSAWDRHGAEASVFVSAGAGRPQDSQLISLQQRVKALEQERDGLSEQLARMSVKSSKQEGELVRLRELGEEVLGLRKQLELSLELLGAKEEEVDDLKETMEEQKQVFQQQLDALLPQ